MIGLLNLGSLVFGLLAWIFPIVSILKFKNKDHKYWVVFSVISMGACAISLFFQILYNYHLVKIGDWSALMDTLGTIAFAASVLLIGTIIFNAITLIIYRNRVLR